MSRRSFAERRLYSLARRSPATGLRLALACGRLRFSLGRAKPGEDFSAREDWLKLLGALSEKHLRRLQKEQSARTYAGRILDYLLKHESNKALHSLVVWENRETLTAAGREGKGVLIGACHVGPLLGFALAMQVLNEAIIAIIHQPIAIEFSDIWEPVFTGEGKGASVRAFREGVKRLKSGGLVFMAADVFTTDQDSLPASAFGLDLKLMRGFAAMSRASGAPVVPVSVRWMPDGRLRFEAHSPLGASAGPADDPESFERAVVAEYGAWVDAHMRTWPEELEPERVNAFIKAWTRLKGRTSEGSAR